MNREQLPPQEFLDRYDDGKDLVPESADLTTSQLTFGVVAAATVFTLFGIGIYQKLQESGVVQ